MTAVFVDTSAAFAILDGDDENHVAALEGWRALAGIPGTPITSNYVVVETVALAARRLGFSAVNEFLTQMVPALAVHWVDESAHARAVGVVLVAGQRNLSLVDCVSFDVMRQLGLDTAFTFDAHFARQGFQPYP